MNALQHRILDPFVIETVVSLNTLANISATPGAAFVDDLRSFSFRGYGVATPTSGAVPGKVLLHLYPETVSEIGRRIYASMTGSPASAANANAFHEVLNEWANVLIGKATRQLEESHLDIDFAPPFFVADTQDMSDVMQDVVEIISVPIETLDAGRFYLNYLIHEKTAP